MGFNAKKLKKHYHPLPSVSDIAAWPHLCPCAIVYGQQHDTLWVDSLSMEKCNAQGP